MAPTNIKNKIVDHTNNKCNIKDTLRQQFSTFNELINVYFH